MRLVYWSLAAAVVGVAAAAHRHHLTAPPAAQMHKKTGCAATCWASTCGLSPCPTQPRQATPACKVTLRPCSTPVPVNEVFTLPNPTSRKVGYLVMKDFITQAEAPLAAAFNNFRAAGASDVIINLRYNCGGRISTATVLASLVAGIRPHQRTACHSAAKHCGARTW